jgi:hypothetical protein
MKRLILPIAALSLAACSTPQPDVSRIEYRTANVAVSAGCVVDPPAVPVPLKQGYTDEQWNALAPGAKAEALKAQAGERLNYEDRLRAASSGCKPVAP